MALNEELLNVWLDLCMTINNDRILNGLTFNEALVCNLLQRQRQQAPDVLLTATDLCQTTGLLKSQMNSVLNALEARGFVRRIRAEEDKRKSYICLQDANLALYWSEHKDILSLTDKVVEQVGAEELQRLIQTLKKISSCVKEELHVRRTHGR